MRRISRVMGLGAVVLMSVFTAVVVLAFHNDARLIPLNGVNQAQVHITRSPGLLVLPALESTITDPALAARLATNIRSLPVAPSVCAGGVSYGTSYTLTFVSPGSPTWTAVIQVFGCDEVHLSNGPTRQARSPALWSDLAQALDLTSDELRPLPCGGPGLTRTSLCYPERVQSPATVPWAPLPYQAYLATPLPIATATPVPRCTFNDLKAQPITTGGATGNEAVMFAFTNRTSHACLTGGYPRVVLSQPGERALAATAGGFWDERSPAVDLDPGATAHFFVGFSDACDTGPPPPPYQHLAVTLPGGGSFTTTLTGTKPPDSQIPLGVSAQCGVTVTELATAATQPVYPRDPLLQLAATISAPNSVMSGSVFTYVITLSNATSEPITLDPCRGYYQQVDSTKSQYFSFELNCGAARPIPARGSESFAMEMTAEGLTAGGHSLNWHLDTDGTPGPQASATLSVVS
ncbi:MAG: DUF4232 domain-containing protein [Candidatus Dormiibacterota bacterium]